jgi:hypothetical protein
MAITFDRPVDRARPARATRPEAVRLTPAPGPRRIRVPELVLGVVLVGVFALGAVLWQSSNNRRVAVAVLATPVAAGDVIDETDLRPAEVALGDGVAAVAWGARQQLVGKTAAAALPAATVLVPGLVVDEPLLAAGEALAGLKLADGAYPAGSLRPGDAVAVVRAAGPEGGEGATVAANATVWDITDLADEPGVLVVLRLSELDATAVSAVADQVRVVRVVR